jgi:hypothetical protein
MGVINRFFVEKLGGTEPSEYVGRPGDVFYDPTASTLELKKSDGSTPGGTALSSSGGITWTRFSFIKNNAPTAPIANSDNLGGGGYGTWTETTFANIATHGLSPSSATYDSTLTGITFDVSDGKFKGFAPGVYQIHLNGAAMINSTNLSAGTVIENYLYAEMKNPAQFVMNSDYFISIEQSPVNVDRYSIDVSGLSVFERTTTSDNHLYFNMSNNDMSPDYYIDYAILDILKIA